MKIVNQNFTVNNHKQAPRQLNSTQQAAQFSNVLANAQQKIKVQRGDTVSELAQKYQTSITAVVQANHLANPDLILTGQELVIPGQNQVQPVNVTPVSTLPVADQQVPAVSTTEQDARAYIVEHESGDNYQARNGRYIGKYQLDQSYLHGDFSPANQEKVAAEYVQKRYGSWANAKQHWVENSWY